MYANDRIFALQSQAHTHDATPKWAFQFDKIRGIIREPGMLIVQITKKSRNFGVIEWFDHDNTILRFIDAIYLCRRLSDELDPDAFSEVLGGQEQRLAIKLHATLIAALSIASIVGGAHIVHRVVEAILKCGPDYVPNAPAWPWKDWQVLNRVRCPCESYITHGPLTPVAAAKAIGIGVWREQQKGYMVRVWDLKRDQLVDDIDVREVIFITHRWSDDEIVYANVANPPFWRRKIISRMSSKLKRIRDTLLHYTHYVWLDTICIDKSNLSELDETIRSMYSWYANCQAVVLDSGTTIELWRSRGWCLQEGAAAGILYGMSDGKLVSIQSLARSQNKYLCKLDLSLYYRRGNAAEILARMDMRQTKRPEDMAYALTGMFAIHLAVAYGEKEKARDRLLRELAIQEGDLSFLSFVSSQPNTGRYLPTVDDEILRVSRCREATSPAVPSHFGLTVEARLITAFNFDQVMSRLTSLKLLRTFSEGRYAGVDALEAAASSTEIKNSKTMYLAIIDEISSIMIIDVHGEDYQTAYGGSIKCCSRLQCCQVERQEFDRLFSNLEAPYERIWLGNKPASGQMVGSNRRLQPVKHYENNCVKI